MIVSRLLLKTAPFYVIFNSRKVSQHPREIITKSIEQLPKAKDAHIRRYPDKRRILRNSRLGKHQHHRVKCAKLLSTVIFRPFSGITKTKAPALLEVRADRWNSPSHSGRLSVVRGFLSSSTLSSYRLKRQWFALSLSECYLLRYFIYSISVCLFWDLFTPYAPAGRR